MRLGITIRKFIGALSVLVACWCLTANLARAQSTSMSAPSAVRSNEVTATIAARDLGDSRLTDHFFSFSGTPGDLLITVESKNLNGDIDVFTLAGMRPLMKFTVYEGSSAVITKSIYLRKREDLILRIEARTPNDDEGTYRVRFGGSFEPISGGPDGGLEIATKDATGATGKKGRRVSSVGARIDEPVTEVAVAAPEPAEKPAREVTPPRSTSRNTRGRRPARGRTNPPTEQPTETPSAETKEEKQESVAESVPTTEKPATESRPATGRRRPGRRSAATRPVEKPLPPPEEESGQGGRGRRAPGAAGRPGRAWLPSTEW